MQDFLNMIITNPIVGNILAVIIDLPLPAQQFIYSKLAPNLEC